MREIRGSVTRRGQVTIPADVRRRLGVKTPGKVAFVLTDDGTVILKPVIHTVLSLAGSIKPRTEEDPGDFDGWIAEAMEKEAERIVATMRHQDHPQGEQPRLTEMAKQIGNPGEASEGR